MKNPKVGLKQNRPKPSGTQDMIKETYATDPHEWEEHLAAWRKLAAGGRAEVAAADRLAFRWDIEHGHWPTWAKQITALYTTNQPDKALAWAHKCNLKQEEIDAQNKRQPGLNVVQVLNIGYRWKNKLSAGGIGWPVTDEEGIPAHLAKVPKGPGWVETVALDICRAAKKAEYARKRAEREDRYARLELKWIAEKTDPSISSLTLLKWEARVARQTTIDKLLKDATRSSDDASQRRQKALEGLKLLRAFVAKLQR